MTDRPPLVCPTCRVELAGANGGLHCAACGRTFPVVAGIPDLRLRGDRYLSMEEDRTKAERLARVVGPAEAVLAAYWRWTPEVPAPLAARYVQHALDGVGRADPHLDEIGAGGGALLDIGCGTGGLLAAAAGRGFAPTGVDIALRWLVVARRLLAEAGCDAELIAADGALLPFPAGCFDAVTCIEVLEHTADQRSLLHAALAAARPGGTGYVVTANRFSLAPEPTVGLWGVGFLPRPVAVRYVARRRRTRYAFMRPRSAAELRAMLGPRASAQITAAPLPGVDGAVSRRRAVAESVYDAVRRTRLGGSVLTAAGPYLQVRRT